MRIPLPDLISEERVIPVARHQDALSAPELVDALEAGGLHSIEITVEGRSGFEAIAALAGSGALVGAGTVTSVDEASAAVAAGARFLVSPLCDPTLIEWAVDRGLAVIPGALTPTEVHTGWSAGASAVKVFPASLGGPDLIHALRAPLPEVLLIPTGGVIADNVAAYIEAGATAVGVGDWLTGGSSPEVISERAALLKRAAQLV